MRRPPTAPGVAGGNVRRGDRGSAVVEFVVVVPLLALVLLAVVQVGLALHVRALVASAAAEGARASAASGGDLAVGVRRTRAVLTGSLADGVVTSVTAQRRTAGAVATVDVEVDARLPLIGLLGPAALVVHGHALVEP
ncbi:MAG: pilus assembly protein [Frankiales bacterium]|nr:pilus assembly protein [Frankiales bacterium]